MHENSLSKAKLESVWQIKHGLRRKLYRIDRSCHVLIGWNVSNHDWPNNKRAALDHGQMSGEPDFGAAKLAFFLMDLHPNAQGRFRAR